MRGGGEGGGAPVPAGTIGGVSDSKTTGVLFVCMGNICRSALAEGVFTHLARERGVLDRFRIDSCGTGGWHAGELADPRMRATAQRHGIELTSIARQIHPMTDFPDLTGDGGFEWILPMDCDNKEQVLALGAPPERVRMFRSFDPALRGKPDEAIEVPDPYYGGAQGFETVYEMVMAASVGLLGELG